MNKNMVILFAGCFIISFFSCKTSAPLKKINAYLNASTITAKSKYLADNYRSYFMEKKGDGKDKTAALKSFQNWDGSLNPDVKILQYTVNDRTWFVQFNEQNDFSKLIDYPGWKGSMSITLNSQGLIQETIYFPDSTNPPYKRWLQPALDWLEKNKPDDLKLVYQDKKLVQNEVAANKWKELLREWRKEKQK